MMSTACRLATFGLLTAAMGLGLAADRASAQDEMADVEITIEAIDPGLHVLFGRGGNIAVSTGPDGVFMVDDQYAPLTDKIRAAIATLSDQPIRFVLNTHWHGDHTGGNENLGKAGTIIVAHDNVYERMSTDQFMAAFDRTVPASPRAALPIISFNDQAGFHLNDNPVRAHHVAYAHTDGDSLVVFEGSNAIHMGDTMFAGRYPFIDLGSGGSLQGIIAANEKALTLIDEDTTVIPGHGPLSTRADVVAYLDMLKTAQARVQALLDDGADLDAILAARPMADYDETWGSGFIDPDRFLRFTFLSLTTPQP